MQMSKMMIRRSLNTLTRLPKIVDESTGIFRSSDITQENLIEVSHQILGDKQQTEINNADLSTYAVEDDTWMSRASSVQKSRLTLISARDSRGEPLVRNPRLDKLFSVVFKHNTPFQTDKYSPGLILRPQRRSSKLKPIMKSVQSNESQLVVAKTTTELSNRTIHEETFMLSREDTLPSSLPYTKQKSIYIDDRPIGLQFNVKI